ncbi:MAG: hypothetical protein LBG45_08990 [Dysgonamonadaceae bacterium]|jgi:ferredoxin|nr:hypothetical protein [Dysgonamonadaceae bacterium]
MYGKENKQFDKEFPFLEQETVYFDTGKRLYHDICRKYRTWTCTGVIFCANICPGDLLHNGDDDEETFLYFGATWFTCFICNVIAFRQKMQEDSRQNELLSIENYIDFQKARFDTDKDIRFNCIQRSSGVISLPPMIFQSLIENCFTYCPPDKAGSYVHIDLEADDRQIRFTSENTQYIIEPSPGKKRDGIGIKNLNKRLYISYRENYMLNITDERDVFRVELTITL